MKSGNTDLRFKKFYEKELQQIEKRISNLFRDSKPKSLYEPCAYALNTGGKRLRPFLVLLSAKAVGGKISKVYNAALAVEILHNFTLIHDDIMDNADVRRGRPSLHKKYDVNTAILAGDNLIAIAYQHLLKDCDNNAKHVMNTFTKGVVEVCEGQSYDKDFETRRKVTIEEYTLMIKKKTAALAEMCCSIGAELGGGTKEEINNMSVYGRNLGLAFQLQDDLLDVFGDEKEFGKAVGGDLMEGKKTFLFLKAVEKAKGKEKEDLLKVIKNKGIKKNQVDKYKNIYLKLGVFEDTKKEIKKYSTNALRAVSKVKNKESGEILNWLTHTLVDRIK